MANGCNLVLWKNIFFPRQRRTSNVCSVTPESELLPPLHHEIKEGSVSGPVSVGSFLLRVKLEL